MLSPRGWIVIMIGMTLVFSVSQFLQTMYGGYDGNYELDIDSPIQSSSSSLSSLSSSATAILVNDTFTYANRTYTYRYYRPITTTRKNKKFLFGVISDPCKPERRQAIRNTWTKLGTNNHDVIYIVANEENSNNIQKCPHVRDNLLQQEFHAHQDMLFLNAKEHYREGLTRKTMAFLQFGHTQNNNPYSTEYEYLFKTDDDVYINVTQMELDLELLTHTTSTPQPPLYYGWALNDSFPIRDAKHRFYISQTEYPRDIFPMYAPGFGYALHHSFVDCAFHLMPTVPFMPWEDVSVGLLAEACNAPLTPAQPQWTQFDGWVDWMAFPYEKYKSGAPHTSILHGLRPEYFLLMQYHLPLPPAPLTVAPKQKHSRRRGN